MVRKDKKAVLRKESGKEKDMTTMIRLFSLNSERHNAQIEKKDLGYVCARLFKDKLERMNCVDEPGNR